MRICPRFGPTVKVGTVNVRYAISAKLLCEQFRTGSRLSALESRQSNALGRHYRCCVDDPRSCGLGAHFGAKKEHTNCNGGFNCGYRCGDAGGICSPHPCASHSNCPSGEFRTVAPSFWRPMSTHIPEAQRRPSSRVCRRQRQIRPSMTRARALFPRLWPREHAIEDATGWAHELQRLELDLKLQLDLKKAKTS